MGERARVRLIRASQSDELRETFRQLSEIDGPNGPKYPRRVLLELAARIAGRAYEPMLLELCHLVRAALLAGDGAPGGRRAATGRPGNPGAGFEWLFWSVEEARAGAFRAAFFHAPAGSVDGPDVPSPAHADGGRPEPGGALHIGDEAVTLSYPGGPFEVRYGRMVDLAAMMELLVSTLGYRALAAALDPLAAPALDRDGVSEAARDLARRLYGWLGDHLPAAQAQRKFHAMVSFLEEARGADFTEEDIDDEAILRFWLRHAAGGADGAHTDFRGYRNTFLAFLAFSRVLSTGAAIGRFERRTPIGTDFEGGEIDPAADSATPEGAPGDEDDPLALLQEEPAVAVKALNRGELALLRLPVGESEGVRRLPRSYLRAECFGPVQNRLSQALRRRAGAAELAAVIAAGPDPGYGARIKALEKAAAHVRRVAKACLYVLHRLAEAASGEEGGDAPRRRAPAIDFRLLGEARTAFEGLNRAGFDRSAPRDPRLAPAYGALADRLPAVSERLGTVLRTLEPPARWEAAEAEDRTVFSHVFTRLYGAGTNEAPPGPDDGERERGRAGGDGNAGAPSAGGAVGSIGNAEDEVMGGNRGSEGNGRRPPRRPGANPPQPAGRKP